MLNIETNPWTHPAQVPNQYQGYLVMMTAYRFPRDYPGKYVLRPSMVGKTPILFDPPFVFDTESELHRACQSGWWIRMNRAPDDDPVVICSYL